MEYFIVKLNTVGEFGFKRVGSEALFDSYNKAFECIQNETLDEYEKQYLFEIQAIEINKEPYDNIKKVWLFDCTGKLIKEIIPEEDSQISKNIGYDSKYKIGDIVQVVTYKYYASHLIDMDTIAVIAKTPDIVDQKNDDFDIEPEYHYSVEFISQFGFLDHDHVTEGSIQVYEGKIPEEQSFLKILSDHYKGIRYIKKDILDDINYSNIFVKNIRFFNPKIDLV